MKVVIIFGIQGSGKGTQSYFISEDFAIPQLSTGAILRSEIEQGTDLGLEVKAVIESGKLVSDNMVNRMVSKRILQSDCANGYILDGYPRTLVQAEYFEKMFKEKVRSIDVVNLSISDDVALMRMKERARELGRADDTEDAIKLRIRTFHTETEPLLDYFEGNTWYNVIHVNGGGSIEAVKDTIHTSLSI